MTTIRIVCTHDAAAMAGTLARLLGAEGREARVAFGRHSLSELPDALAQRDGVLLIWSHEAPGAHYMLEWAARIDPAHLIEIANAPGWPQTNRRAPVIDFSGWRGERGGRAWHALCERLRQVTRALEPASPAPHRAAMALGLAGVAAVGGALLVRVNDVIQPGLFDQGDEREHIALDYNPAHGVGGALIAIEPASLLELEEIEGPLIAPRLQAAPAPLPAPAPMALAALPDVAPARLRDPTMIERIAALNPIERLGGSGAMDRIGALGERISALNPLDRNSED